MNTLYTTAAIGTLEAFKEYLAEIETPVVLLEGSRKVAEEDQEKLVAFGKMLAEELPNVLFRSGNAEGSDTLFLNGVCSVDPKRAEYILPYEGMGRKRRNPDAAVKTIEGLSKAAETMIAENTYEASPDTKNMVVYYQKKGRHSRTGAKAVYLMRDTLKVTGDPAAGIPPASAAIFYANAEDPMKGGTGHTIRACIKQTIPYVLQHEWMRWRNTESQ